MSSLLQVLAILQTIHKLEPRPDLVDCANFYIDEAGVKSDLPNIVLGKVGCHAGSLFRPGNP